MISTICSIISCIFFITMYTMLLKLKYTKLTSILLILIGAPLSEGFYLFLIHIDLNPSLASLIGLTGPSILFFYFLSEYRDSRFIFTFCSLDIIGMTILFLVKAICHYLNIDFLAPIFLIAIYGLLIYGGFKIKDSYRDIQNKLADGWNNLSNISVLLYIMYDLLIGYPSPINDRPEYIPVICLYSVTVLLVYTILFKQVSYMNSTYKFKESEQLELKNSQLEVQKLYYKMAHIDTLTNLRNRYSYEERKSQLSIELHPDSYICCISMDLNNLKVTNDSLGHNTGDELIKNFSSILMKSYKNNNISIELAVMNSLFLYAAAL